MSTRRANESEDRPARALPLSHRRSFVAHHTRVQPLPGLPGLRLHLADDAVPVWQATEAATGVANAPLPFWAFAWSGGLALARYVAEHPHEVRGRRVLDFATGSGLVAIWGLLGYVRRHDYSVFAIYRVALALFVLSLIVTGVRDATL